MGGKLWKTISNYFISIAKMLQMNRFRICVCYLITTLLISVFVYSLISNNIQSMKKLERLREDVDEIAHLVLRSPPNGKEPHHLSDMVDNMIKKRLSGIWDDLYALKKMLKGGSGCANTNSVDECANNNNDGSVVKVDERINYASEELGAQILNVKADPICAQNLLKSWMGLDFVINPPIRMLKSGMEAGNCFGFKKQTADVTIQLAHEILIDQIVVEHITKKQTPTEDTSSAPKDFQVFGITGDMHEFRLGKFRFDNNVDRPLQDYSFIIKERIEYIRFLFESNHGHPNYTCIYRIAVYGTL